MNELMTNGIRIYHYPSTVSTNALAMERKDYSHLSVIVADTQTGGRGRLGRSFYSYEGGLYMSVLLEPSVFSLPIALITPAAAIAVKAALEASGIDGLGIKWVNDIMRDGKKVCGILTEAKTLDGKLERFVVGIGINLSEHDGNFPEDIVMRAGSLKTECDRLELAADIARRLGEYLTADAHAVVSEYSKSLAFLGQRAFFTDLAAPDKKICGRVLGVTDECFLKIELEDGSIKLLSSGEIL